MSREHHARLSAISDDRVIERATLSYAIPDDPPRKTAIYRTYVALTAAAYAWGWKTAHVLLR